jgi:hypothetical protein
LVFKLEYSPYNFLIRSFAKFETSDMTLQHEGEGSLNPEASPACSTSGAGSCLKTTPNAPVRAASIHKNDDANVSYRVYGSYDLGWEGKMEKDLVRTILSMKVSEVKEFLAALEKHCSPTIKTLTECLKGLRLEELDSEDTSYIRVLYE